MNAFVHFYQHDYKFDGVRCGIWFAPWRAAKIFSHFARIITPDFSTYADFPFPIKIYNTYRMRAFGYWYGTIGGAVASGLKNSANRELFNNGFAKMLDVLQPHTVIVYDLD